MFYGKTFIFSRKAYSKSLKNFCKQQGGEIQFKPQTTSPDFYIVKGEKYKYYDFIGTKTKVVETRWLERCQLKQVYVFPEKRELKVQKTERKKLYEISPEDPFYENVITEKTSCFYEIERDKVIYFYNVLSGQHVINPPKDFKGRLFGKTSRMNGVFFCEKDRDEDLETHLIMFKKTQKTLKEYICLLEIQKM